MKYIILITCLSFATIFSQQLIPRLPDHLSQLMPIYIAITADSYIQCMQTMKNLSCISKPWHTTTKKYASESPERKSLGLILNEKFYLSASNATKWDLEALKKQIECHNETALQHTAFYKENCLGYAIIQNKKVMVEYLSCLPGIKLDYELVRDVRDGYYTIPLPTLAITYSDENDTFILECLLKAGINIDRELYIKPEGLRAVTSDSWKKYTLSSYTSEQGKTKILALLNQYRREPYRPGFVTF